MRGILPERGGCARKSPAEAGHKVIGSSSSTNCGPASQPLLSGRSETRAQNCRQARSKNVEPRGWFRQARGPRQKKPRQEARLFRPPPGLPTWRSRKAPVGSPTPFNRAAGALADQRRVQPMRVNQGAGHRNSAASHDRTSSRAVGSASAHAPRRGTRPNSRPWGINAVLARTAGRLSSSIASRTALAAGRLSNAVAARTASRAA